MNDLRRHAVSAVALVALGLAALGSGKSGDQTPTSTAAPGASGAAVAADDMNQPVLATCTIKFSNKLAECSENFGAIPGMAADLCKGSEGVFQTGSTPCPKEGRTGSCFYKAANPGDPGETHHFYAGAIGDPKGSCEALGAKWFPAAGAAATATAKGSAAPAAPAKK